MNNQADLPIAPLSALTPSLEPALLVAAPATAVPEPQLELRPLITARPDPVLKWHVNKRDKFSIQFGGEVSGHGTVELKVYAPLGSAVARIKLKEFRSMIFNFPAEGGSKEFKTTVSVRAATVYGWILEAKNKGKWSGYHDLRGCCDEPSIQARCLAGGAVQCGGNKQSARCRC